MEYLVLQRFEGLHRGQRIHLEPGDVASDSHYDIVALRQAGCALITYTSAMTETVDNFRSAINQEIRLESILADLLAAGVFVYPGHIEVLGTIDLDFIASNEEVAIIPISGQVQEVVRGRLYIDEDPGAPFDAYATYTFYERAAMRGPDALWRSQAKMVYTELATATTGSDTSIIPDDYTDFSPNDLVLILDAVNGDEFARLAAIAPTMIAEDIAGAHPINSGLVRVSEFRGFSLLNMEGGENVYFKLRFVAPQTVSLKLELVVRQ